MPQMSPLMWLTLFLFFSLLLVLSMVKIYFAGSSVTKLIGPNYKNNETDKINKNWQW